MASIEERPEDGPAFCDTMTLEAYNVAREHERDRLGLPINGNLQPLCWWYEKHS